MFTYFGYTDPFGRNEPDEVFEQQILPILENSNISEENRNTIIEAIREMCQRSYDNGSACNSFYSTPDC